MLKMEYQIGGRKLQQRGIPVSFRGEPCKAKDI